MECDQSVTAGRSYDRWHFPHHPKMDATDAARCGRSQVWPPHTDGVEVCMVGFEKPRWHRYWTRLHQRLPKGGRQGACQRATAIAERAGSEGASVRDVGYIRMFAKAAQVQFQAVLDARNDQVSWLGELPTTAEPFMSDQGSRDSQRRPLNLNRRYLWVSGRITGILAGSPKVVSVMDLKQ